MLTCAATLAACNLGSKTFTVTFDKQSGTGGADSATVTLNKTMPSGLPAPVREGYTFGGYYAQLNGEGTQYYDAEMKSVKNWDVEASMTLFAKWVHPTDAGVGEATTLRKS